MRRHQSSAGQEQMRQRKLRGVSLVEALVSLAVMSFGMLGVVGVQATLRYNSEVSKQRSEAVRIAQEEMESLRSFVQQGVDASGVRRAYADLQDGSATRTFSAALTTNTSFNIERNVADGNNGFKSVRVRVLWSDRNGNAESVTLASQIASLGLDSTADLLRRETISQPDSPVGNRHVSIPAEALTLQADGTRSVFKPPQDGTNSGTVAWIFNNTTGLIVGVCDVASDTTAAQLQSSDLSRCSSNANRHLLSGTVRFSTGQSEPKPADAENPNSTALNLDVQLDSSTGRIYCFDDAPTTRVVANAQLAVRYYCAIPASANRVWQGISMVTPPRTEPAGIADADRAPRYSGLPTISTGEHRLCRYTPATNETVWVPNEQHPRFYGYVDAARQVAQTTPMGNLVEQNFLVIRSAFDCPKDVPANPAMRDFVNSNTLVHLPL
jgi:hypothetical protein